VAAGTGKIINHTSRVRDTTASTPRYGTTIWNLAGTPDPALGTTSLLDYASDLIQEIEKLDEKPVIMGHSMGGLLTQIVGSRVSAKALVLLTPASPAGINILKPSVMKTFLSAQLKWGFWRKPMRLTFREATYSMLQLLTPEEQRAVYDKYVYESGRAAFEMGFWFLDGKKASRVDESKITCPMLVIAGGLDKITPHSVVQKVAEKYRAVSTYRLFDKHSHWVGLRWTPSLGQDRGCIKSGYRYPQGVWC